MLTVWRIVGPAYVDDAFSGEGAELHGGRFNSKGRKVVYTAGSISLTLLELLVQAGKKERLAGHLCLPATFDEAHVELLVRTDLPAGWDARPYTRVSQEIGDQWWEEQRSLVLGVPSVVVPQEYNYLINPLHPAFDEIEIGSAFPAPFDRRLIEGSG